MSTVQATPLLSVSKSSSNSVSTVGGIITYQITVTNTSTIPLFDISISDPLAASLKYIPGSVKINGTQSPSSSILSGIFVGSLDPTKSATVSFRAEVLSKPTSNFIYNTSNAQYAYKDPATQVIKYGSANSNQVAVQVYNVNLKILKKSDKKNVSIGDIVGYSVTLTNTGDVDLLNVLFTDLMPSSLQLVNGSFTINGSTINNINLEQGIVIPRIAVNQTATITYKAKVVAASCSKTANEARAKYRYVLPDGTSSSGETKIDQDSVVVISTNMSNFKQFSIEEYLQIPCQKPDMESINSSFAKIEITKCSTVRTGAITSIEGQTLTNYKLVVQGLLNLIIEYTACKPEQNVHSAHFSIPFSTFIILPIDFEPGINIEVNGVVEDVYAKNLDCRSLFSNTTVLLSAKVPSC